MLHNLKTSFFSFNKQDAASVFSERSHYNLGLLMGAILYAPLGFVYSQYFFSFEHDGFFKRLPISLVCGLLYTLSKREYFSLKQLRIAVLFVGLWITQDFAMRAELNNYHILFLTGIVQTSLIVSLVFYHKIDAIIFFFINIIIGLYYLRNHDYMGTYYPLIVGTYYYVYYYFLSNRKAVVEELIKVNKDLKKKSNVIIEANNRLKSLNDVAIQVAHDIRAPVQALDFVSKTLEITDFKKQKLINDAIQRINEVAENMLMEFKKDSNNNSSTKMNNKADERTTVVNTFNITQALESILNEKKIIVRNDIKFEVKNNLNNSEVKTLLVASEFKRMFSNVINNAIDACTKGTGVIVINISENRKDIIVSIQDNGKGISEDVLPNIGQRGFSLKGSGVGIGLSYVNEKLKAIDGKLEIHSKLGKGTLVTLCIPKV